MPIHPSPIAETLASPILRCGNFAIVFLCLSFLLKISLSNTIEFRLFSKFNSKPKSLKTYFKSSEQNSPSTRKSPSLNTHPPPTPLLKPFSLNASSLHEFSIELYDVVALLVVS